MQLTKNFIKSSCKLALNEDLFPLGDITSNLIDNNQIRKLKLISNQKCIVGGINFFEETFRLIDKKIKCKIKKKDGSKVKKGSTIAIIEGSLKNILSGERVALNFVSHISGIATKTNEFVKKGGKTLVGTHDFSTFRASTCTAKSAIKKMNSIVIKKSQNKIILTFKSKSFLQNQVRSMVGCLEKLSSSEWSLKKFKEVLKSKKRTNCAPPAPAHGLYLKNVRY